MGLMLSLLIGCAGVLEAIACYETIKNGFIPRNGPSLDALRKAYDVMFAESLSKGTSGEHVWRLGVQGYLDIQGGGKNGPMKAQIKYLGTDEDPIPMLFSTKISSFGQESVDYETIKPVTPERTPERSTNLKVQEPFGASFSLSTSQLSPFSSHENLKKNFWDDDDTAEAEPKEKIKWHYRPLTPTEDQNLPTIHFDSYERKSSEKDNADSPYSEEFLRSLDGIKFRPLQRDDGTGRRRSFKKRHSSSSTSSRESSKASREEELKVFTSLEESEFESYKVSPNYSSAPNLTIDMARRSRSPSKRSSEDEEKPAVRMSKSPSTERPLLKNIPKSPSFDESCEATSTEAIDRTKKANDDISKIAADGQDECGSFLEKPG